MTKKSTLLTVVSIIMIVIAAIGLFVVVAGVGSVFSLAGDKATLDAAMLYVGIDASLFYFEVFFAIIACIIMLVAGILGLAAKKKKIFVIMGIITLLLEVVSLIFAGVTGVLSPLNFISLVLPILYYIGATQCID